MLPRIQLHLSPLFPLRDIKRGGESGTGKTIKRALESGTAQKKLRAMVLGLFRGTFAVFRMRLTGFITALFLNVFTTTGVEWVSVNFDKRAVPTYPEVNLY